MYYLDSSAIAKRYRTEKGSEVVSALFAHLENEELAITSQFASVEVEALAARALKARLLNRRSYGVMLRLFAGDLERSVLTIPVSSSLVSDAAQIARSLAVRAGDAIHLATAVRVQQIIALKVILVASDRELLLAAESVGFTTFNPESQDALIVLESLRENS